MLRAILELLLAFAVPPSGCDAPVAAAFSTNTGASLTPTAQCGTYILSTDSAMNVPFSWGEMTWPEPVSESFEVTLTWRRLTPDTRRSVELHVPGGAVMIRQGQWSYYESNSKFAARGGYRTLDGHDAAAEHSLKLQQRASVVRLWVDGRELPSTVWGSKLAEGEVVVALKGEPGLRSRELVRSLRVTPLSAIPTDSPETSAAQSQ